MLTFVKAGRLRPAMIGAMDFTSLHDPTSLARAYGALDSAWAEIRSRHACSAKPDVYLEQLACIILQLLDKTSSDGELVGRAVQRFLARRLH